MALRRPGFVRRGDVFDARLDPVEGSEQAGTRPVIVVSRDALNDGSPVVVVVPCTTWKADRKIYPSEVVVRTPDGGLSVDSIALGQQVRAIAKTRLRAMRGSLSLATLQKLDRALLIALDLPGADNP